MDKGSDDARSDRTKDEAGIQAQTKRGINPALTGAGAATV